MHVLNDRICNNPVKKFARCIVFCIKMTGRMSSKTCYTTLNFYFPYVRPLSLRRNRYMYVICFYFLVTTALLFIVYYYKCLNIKCIMNLLTLVINSNGSDVMPMLNLCTLQMLLSQACLSKNFYHQCKIILYLRCINFTIIVS